MEKALLSPSITLNSCKVSNAQKSPQQLRTPDEAPPAVLWPVPPLLPLFLTKRGSAAGATTDALFGELTEVMVPFPVLA
jgi:hypothetical protein